MGEIINLRRARKAASRDEAAVSAAENRAFHGRTKTERAADAADMARREALLDGAMIDRADEKAAGD